MDSDELTALRDRVDMLERKVRDLTARLTALESRTGPRVENPLDAQAVREKSVYDWQGPR